MKIKTKIRKTNNAVQLFIKQFKKLLKNTIIKMKKIWLVMLLFIAVAAMNQACNVTRKVTTEASYFQKGDTTTTIITKTIESYDATKKQ